MYEADPPARLQQGCLVQDLYFDATGEEQDAVTLSPACDFENAKAQFATFICLRSFSDFLPAALQGWWKDAQLPEPGAAPSKSKMKALRGHLKKLVNGQYPRYHWFDAVGDVGPWVADFQLVSCVPQEDFEELKLIAKLSSKYMEQLPSRWVAYAGRIGVPDRPDEHFEAVVATASGIAYKDPPSPTE